MGKIIPLVLIYFICFGAPENVATSQESNYKIYGQVFDRNGEPISDTSITVESGGKKIAKVLTDVSGDYKIEGLGKGIYLLVVEVQGFVTQERPILLLYREIVNVDFGLEAGVIPEYPSQISGIIKDNKGHPIKDATVKIINPFGGELLARGTTNAQGRYKLYINVGGQGITYAYKPGFSVKSMALKIREHEQINFVLRRYKT
jgi:hypothetical protein